MVGFWALAAYFHTGLAAIVAFACGIAALIASSFIETKLHLPE